MKTQLFKRLFLRKLLQSLLNISSPSDISYRASSRKNSKYIKYIKSYIYLCIKFSSSHLFVNLNRNETGWMPQSLTTNQKSNVSTYNLRINRNLIITRVSSNTPRFSSTKLEAHKGVAHVRNRAKPCVYDASVNGASDSRRLCGRRPAIWIPRDI